MKIIAGIVGSIAAIFILLMVIGLIGRANDTSSGRPKFDPEETSALLAIASLGSAARDPDSVIIENLVVTDAASCVTYRARNGFGGMNRGKAVFGRDAKSAFSDTDSGFVKAWNRSCANKTARDLTRFAQFNLKKLK